MLLPIGEPTGAIENLETEPERNVWRPREAQYEAFVSTLAVTAFLGEFQCRRQNRVVRCSREFRRLVDR